MRILLVEEEDKEKEEEVKEEVGGPKCLGSISVLPKYERKNYFKTEQPAIVKAAAN